MSVEQEYSVPRDFVSLKSRDKIMDNGNGGCKAKLGSQKIKWFSFNVDSTNSLPAPRPSSSQGCLGARGQGRRPSFLYRSESPEDVRELKIKSDGNTENHDVNVVVPDVVQKQRHKHYQQSDGNPVDEQICTPFARILHRLHSVRTKYAQFIGSTFDKDSRKLRNRNDSGHSSTEYETGKIGKTDSKSSKSNSDDSEFISRGREILDELDWCLEHLDNLQTHKSVADLASTKFKRILNKELNEFSESGKGGSQVKEYISHTFLDNNDEDADAVAPLPSDAKSKPIPQKNGNAVPQKTSPMSLISSLSRSTTKASVKGTNAKIPKYGVEGVRLDSLDPLMVNIDVWGIDIFKINDATNGHALTAVTFTILKDRDLLRKFDIPEIDMLNYLRLVESHYHPAAEVPYHNQLHAADVTQGVHSLMSLPKLQDVYNDTEQLAVIIAATIHDIDHPGVTNQYLINTDSELAVMYNDVSVLENHSLAVAFKLMQQPGCNIFENFPRKMRHKIRKMIIDLVMATDMSKHMSLLAALKTMAETMKDCSSSTQQVLKDNPSCRFQALESMIHAADLSNPTKSLTIYMSWTDRIMQEFFKQGDIERELKLEISPMCDRHTATVEKSQIGFIDYIVQPQWETWADFVFPDCSDILDTLEENRQWYQNRLDALSPTPTSPASPALPSSPAESEKRTGKKPAVVTQPPTAT